MLNKEQLLKKIEKFIDEHNSLYKQEQWQYKEKLYYVKEVNKWKEKVCDLEIQVESNKLQEQIKIMEKYFELIVDLGYDYDGFTKANDLKGLIDELVRLASLGRAANITEVIYENKNKKMNILGEEIREENEDTHE